MIVFHAGQTPEQNLSHKLNQDERMADIPLEFFPNAGIANHSKTAQTNSLPNATFHLQIPDFNPESSPDPDAHNTVRKEWKQQRCENILFGGPER